MVFYRRQAKDRCDDPVVLDRDNNQDISRFEEVRGPSEEADISMRLWFFDNT